MRKSYLLVYSATLGTRPVVSKTLNEMSEVKTWRYDLTNMFFVVSENSAQELAKAFRSKHSSGQFIFSEISAGKYWGWLSNRAWHVIKNKRLKPKDKD